MYMQSENKYVWIPCPFWAIATGLRWICSFKRVVVPIHGVYGVDQRGYGDYGADDDEEGDRLPRKALPPDPFHHSSGSTLLMCLDVLTEVKQVVRHARVAVLVPEATEEFDDLLVVLCVCVRIPIFLSTLTSASLCSSRAMHME